MECGCPARVARPGRFGTGRKRGKSRKRRARQRASATDTAQGPGQTSAAVQPCHFIQSGMVCLNTGSPCPPGAAGAGRPRRGHGPFGEAAVLEQAVVQDDCAGDREVEGEAGGDAHHVLAAGQQRGRQAGAFGPEHVGGGQRVAEAGQVDRVLQQLHADQRASARQGERVEAGDSARTARGRACRRCRIGARRASPSRRRWRSRTRRRRRAPVRSSAPILADLDTPSAPMPKYRGTQPGSSPGYRRSMTQPTDATDALLAAQYEAFPYPARDPARRGAPAASSAARAICARSTTGYSPPPARRAPLRALVAGGGTGDGAIMLAQQLASPGGPAASPTWTAQPAAPRIAEAGRQHAGCRYRVAARLAAGPAGLGPGPVRLHRLLRRAAPSAGPGRPGCARCSACWRRAAGSGLMVYAPHGRTGVYMLQDALRLLAPDGEPAAGGWSRRAG